MLPEMLWVATHDVLIILLPRRLAGSLEWRTERTLSEPRFPALFHRVGDDGWPVKRRLMTPTGRVSDHHTYVYFSSRLSLSLS